MTVPPPDPPKRPVQLLTTVAEVDAEGRRSERVFAQILELGEKEIVLESARELEVGEELELGFFVPVRGGFRRVRMACHVDRAVDPGEMLYSAAILEIDEVSREVLAGYVSAAPRRSD